MTVYIFEDSLKNIYKEISVSRGIETGGILLGVVLNNGDILITHAIDPGPKAIKKRNEFQKDYDYSMKMLNRLYNKYSVDYLGEWHKHPDNNVQYSSKDYEAMVRITRINIRPCFFIIVGNDYTINNYNNYINIFSLDYQAIKVVKHAFKTTKEPEKIALAIGIDGK